MTWGGEHGLIERAGGQVSFEGGRGEFIVGDGFYKGLSLNTGKVDFDINEMVFRGNVGILGNVTSMCHFLECSNLDWIDMDTLDGNIDVNVGFVYEGEKSSYIGVRGKIKGVSGKILNGWRLEGGDFDLISDSKSIKIIGDGLINGRDMMLSFKKPQNADKYHLKLKGDFLIEDVFHNGLLPVSREFDVNGEAEGEFLIRYENSLMNVIGSIAMKGVNVGVNRLDWKGVEDGEINFNFDMAENNEVILRDFFWQSGNISFKAKGKFDDNVYIDVTDLKFLDSNCNVEYVENINGDVSIMLRGQSVILKNMNNIFQGTSNEGADGRLKIDWKVDNMYLDNEVWLHDVELRLDLVQHEVEDFYLDAKGEGAVFVQGGIEGEEVYLISNNAGVVTDGLNLSNSISKGYLTAFFDRRKDEYGKIFGHIVIRNFEMIDAPILGRILSLATLPIGSIISLLGGEGIPFYRMRITMEYDNDRIVVKEGLAESSPLGIKFKGPINTDDGSFDMSGVVIPAYMLNKAISKIPLIGGLITGGDESGLIAVNYNAKGTIDDYNVSVDTISLLAPGIFRNILGAFYDGKGDRGEALEDKVRDEALEDKVRDEVNVEGWQ